MIGSRFSSLIPSRIDVMICAIIAFAFTAWPFFWYGTLYSRVAYVLLAACISLFHFANRSRARFNVFTLGFIAFLIVAILSTALSEHEEIRGKFASRTLVYLCLAGAVVAMSSLPFRHMVTAANAVTLIFIFASLPSVLIFLSFVFGVDLPYTLIDLGGRGSTYRLYPFGVLSESAIFDYRDFGRPWLVRISGFSEEPGVLATFTVFFIVLNRYLGPSKSKKRREMALHVLGTLSMSLFYYVSVCFVLAPWLIGTVSRLTRRGRITRSRLLLLTAAILVAGVILSFIKPGNPLYYWTLARFTINESGTLAGNSRADYDYRAFEYVRETTVPQLLIGNGPGSNSIDQAAQYSSWAADLYDTGAIGLTILMTTFGYIAVRSSVVEGRLSFSRLLVVLPLMLSYYQRPDILSPIMLISWVILARVFPSPSAIGTSILSDRTRPPIAGTQLSPDS